MTNKTQSWLEAPAEPNKITDEARLKELTENKDGEYLKPEDIGIPTGPHVIVKKTKPVETSAGGIILTPSSSKDQAHRVDGYILAIGETAFTQGIFKGTQNPPKPGDKVMFPKLTGYPITMKGIECNVIFDDDVKMVIPEHVNVKAYIDGGNN